MVAIAVLDLPTLQELEALLSEGNGEAVALALVDRCSPVVLEMIQYGVVSGQEQCGPKSKLTELFESTDMMGALTLAVKLKKLGQHRRRIGLRVQTRD